MCPLDGVNIMNLMKMVKDQRSAKNENLWSDKKLSVKSIIRPQPLNLNIINEINSKSMNN